MAAYLKELTFVDLGDYPDKIIEHNDILNLDEVVLYEYFSETVDGKTKWTEDKPYL